MVRLSFLLLSFVFIFFCANAIAAPASNIYPDCKVAEVLSVYDGVNFSCKAGGDDLLGGMRLHVSIRGIDKAPDKDAAVKFIKKQLAEAKYIELKNVYMRYYFRVTADVKLDGKGLAEMLIKENLATPQVQDLKKVVEKPKTSDLFSKTKTATPDEPAKPGKSFSNTGWRPQRAMIDMSLFEPDMRFEDAIDIVRNSVDPPLPIAVMWREIEANAFIDKDTPIGFTSSGKMTPGGALRLLLSSMGEIGTGLQYAIGDGIITIASTEMELRKKTLGVYDISQLVASQQMPMMYGGGGYGNMYGNQGNSYGNNSRGSYGNDFGGSYGNNSSSSYGNYNYNNRDRRRPSGTGMGLGR